MEDEKNHFEHVGIEVSCYEEYTSEEEFDNKFAKTLRQSTYLGKSFFGNKSELNRGSPLGGGQTIVLSKSTRKKRNINWKFWLKKSRRESKESRGRRRRK
jgi:hypothetical protein